MNDEWPWGSVATRPVRVPSGNPNFVAFSGLLGSLFKMIYDIIYHNTHIYIYSGWRIWCRFIWWFISLDSCKGRSKNPKKWIIRWTDWQSLKSLNQWMNCLFYFRSLSTRGCVWWCLDLSQIETILIEL